MRLGLNFASSIPIEKMLPLVQQADDLGYDSIWVAESYGTDAVTVLAYIAAKTQQIKIGSGVLQMPARTPAMTAMTAMSLDLLSQGRFMLGLGVSGPQVVEGWHGVSYARPLTRTREYVEIVRRIVAREERLSFQGEVYRIPYDGADATGLGKPLKSILHPIRNRIPIYLASIGPKNVRLTGEIADGWLPILYSPEREDVFAESLDAGLAAAGRTRDDLAICAKILTAMGDDIDACRDELRPTVALYVGGMGARGKNFYHDLVARYGFEKEADEIQDLYLEGKKAEAIAAVPDQLVDEVSLIGPPERIKDRLEAWRESSVDVLTMATTQPELITALADVN